MTFCFIIELIVQIFARSRAFSTAVPLFFDFRFVSLKSLFLPFIGQVKGFYHSEFPVLPEISCPTPMINDSDNSLLNESVHSKLNSDSPILAIILVKTNYKP